MIQKVIILTSILISFGLQAQSKCPLLPLYDQEKFEFEDRLYTPFWAQEYVGVDLVKKEMRSIMWAKKVPFVVLDTGFVTEAINLSTSTNPQVEYGKHYHGTCVANIINGKGAYGSSEQVDYLALVGTMHTNGYVDALNSLLDQNNPPKLISNSMKWGSDLSPIEDLMNEAGSIWVASAGNLYPRPIPTYKDKSGAILVGSLRPTAFQADSSQESPNLTIMAPSNNEIASIGINGEHRKFGGTSGATPLVSGSLANVASLLPDLTLEQAKILLRKTEITTANQLTMPGKNPAGMLNSYKLFRVAKRIALSCGRHLGIVDLDCEDTLIRDDNTYQLFITEIERDEFYTQLERAFPRCFKRWSFDTKSCHHKVELFNKLRKMALLEPDRSEHWKHLSCIAKQNGYSGNGNFYFNLASLNQTDDSQKIVGDIIANGCYPQMTILREAKFDSSNWSDLFLRMINENRCLDHTLKAAIDVKAQGQQLLYKISKILKNRRQPLSTRRLAAEVFLKIKAEDLRVIKTVSQVLTNYKEDQMIRKLTALALENYPGTTFEQALVRILKNRRDSVEWRRWAATRLKHFQISDSKVISLISEFTE